MAGARLRVRFIPVCKGPLASCVCYIHDVRPDLQLRYYGAGGTGRTSREQTRGRFLDGSHLSGWRHIPWKSGLRMDYSGQIRKFISQEGKFLEVFFFVN